MKLNKDSPKQKQLANLLESYTDGKPSQIIEDNVNPYRYWTREKIIEEAQKVVEKYGDLPGQKRLKALGYSPLSAAIQTHYNFTDLRNELGLEAKRKANGYWTLENTLKECKKIIKQEGKLPSQTRLKELKQTSLSMGIDKHGGFHKIRGILGISSQATEKPKNYWTKEKTISTYQELSKKEGKPLSANDLNRLGYNGMSWNIQHKYGGFRKIKELLGFTQSRKIDGYWTRKKTLDICSQIVKEKGDLPPWSELLKLSKEDRYRGFATGVTRLGIRKIRNIFQLKERAKPDHYWTKSRIKKEAKKILNELGYLPSQQEFQKMGKSSFAGSISREYGFPKLRKELGLVVKKVENGFWTEEKILEECKELIKKTNDLPSSDTLKKMDKGALATQILKNGGFRYYRELLNLNQKSKNTNYWKNEKNAIKEARRIMKENNLKKLPSQFTLAQMGYSSLAGAIATYYGGFNEFRKKLGEKNVRNKMGSLKNWETYKPLLEEWIKELGHFPTPNDARQKGMSGVYAAITQYGGIQNVKEKLGFQDNKINQLESLLEEYAGEEHD